MNSTFYLPRRLSSNEKIYSEKELLATSNYIIVLAEPGGGKTELMKSLAKQLGSSLVTANLFRHIESDEKNYSLVIDAFDELAKVDQTGVHKLFANARKANPTHVIISSRSSEWYSSTTSAFKEFIGCSPLVVKLCEFDEAEQQKIFENHAKNEDFQGFRTEVARFDLEILLPNPQFLKLFADAYIESERRFTSKHSIFVKAIEHLAKESNTKVSTTKCGLSTTQKVDLSSEVFAKLLLSGAEGISTSEASENLLYPLLASLANINTVTNSILATRLFKPGNNADQHRPVHKIVAEYCAADYLTKRIAAPADSLTLPKCLAIIAPNSAVRDELRGLLGWMAALGNKPIEKAAIELDPYAVLANGDPSQLEKSSKCLLINQLKKIEDIDPYFRRGDSWRRFSVAGFFTQDVVEEIKPLLKSNSNGHLHHLTLELISGSPAAEKLKVELCQLTLAPKESETTRLLASRCLLSLPEHDHHADLSALVSEASNTSLIIVAEAIEKLGPESFEHTFLKDFFRACTSLYPSHDETFGGGAVGARYSIKQLIACLTLETVESLLDVLTKDLACICGKESYECDCRNGISKIVGSMLDHYFDLANPPFNLIRIWQWLKNLNFHESKTVNQSKAVKVLQEDDELRQGIIAHVFEKLKDRDQIFKAKLHMFGLHSHSGLHLQADDDKFLVDLAFRTDNPNLWASFISSHQYYRNKGIRGPDSLRRHMREQAREKPSFMREWAKSNRAEEQFRLRNQVARFKHTRRMRRRRRQNDDIRRLNIKYIQANRELVESGCHWSCLVHFARLVLNDSDKIEQEFGDKTLVRSALRNCLDFLAPKIPDLLKLAELHCTSKILHAEVILYAACLEIMRVKGNLESVDLRLLKALRTNFYTHYKAVTEGDRIALKNEIDRLIFSGITNAESFLRQYVEPQLEQLKCNYPQVDLLREDVFSHLRATLSIEWLNRFHELASEPLNTLFEIAAQYGNRDDLNEIIVERCSEFISNSPNQTAGEDIDQMRKFWYLRAFCFLKDVPKKCWDWFKADKDAVFVLRGQLDLVPYRGNKYWPKLTSNKVEGILDAFIDKWPKVDLPNSWGTDSPKEEKAYRFLTDVIWLIDSDDPDDAIPVLDRLLSDMRFVDLHNTLKSMRAGQVRKKVLMNFEPPTPQEIVDLLDHNEIVTVEGLRQLVIQELQEFQGAINGGEYNSADRFYEKDKRLDEVRSTEIIAERLNLKLEPQGISVTPEHQLKDAKRSDFTVTKMISGRRCLLVTEVKGQWHPELYTAASTQLHERYSIHPDAEQQGVFLVIWFGIKEKVAGRIKHGIRGAKELKSSIEAKLPPELIGLIDVFVLDVSKP
ncbi:hypothetical protein [Spartinivicinus poritis]|uniref:ATP-binding protein n=1 Tax=Spartinivicinus poritis TaxID=2994640 RepID=A0ABT5UFN9_9GAMM|nr:hypothetical protein [Spartinivicinus sp. A2-2]MDE1465200.1 hypothetical protein [Spartinivicinus sp. A2-2]